MVCFLRILAANKIQRYNWIFIANNWQCDILEDYLLWRDIIIKNYWVTIHFKQTSTQFCNMNSGHLANFLSLHFSDPDFVSTYEIEDFIYVFFREMALEYDHCGKSVYSRVARICKVRETNSNRNSKYTHTNTSSLRPVIKDILVILFPLFWCEFIGFFLIHISWTDSVSIQQCNFTL